MHVKQNTQTCTQIQPPSPPTSVFPLSFYNLSSLWWMWLSIFWGALSESVDWESSLWRESYPVRNDLIPVGFSQTDEVHLIPANTQQRHTHVSIRTTTTKTLRDSNGVVVLIFFFLRFFWGSGSIHNFINLKPSLHYNFHYSQLDFTPVKKTNSFCNLKLKPQRIRMLAF